jgi:hypothetical protein
MGTERWICETAPCPCGQGTIEIEHASPDHGWAQETTLSPRLLCAACDELYAFANMRLVRTADAESYYAAQERYQLAKAALDNLPMLDKLRSALVPVLEAMPTKVARHRWLLEHRIVGSTYGTFLKHWDKADRWVRHGVNRYNMLEVAVAVGADPTPILEHQALVDKLQSERFFEMEAIPTGMRNLAA